MNKIDQLLSALMALEMLSDIENVTRREPTVVEGFVLVELTDGNMIYDEGVRQHNALIMPQMRETLRNNGMSVFSVRDAENMVSLLTLSVGEDNICKHVVGKHNAAPSADQLDILHRLLAAEGIELQYNPFSMY